MLFLEENIPSAKTILSAAASLAATAVLFRTVTDDLVPDAIRDYFFTSLRNLSGRLSSQLTVVIEEFDGLTANHMFESANIYLASKISPSTRRIKVNKPAKEKELTITIDKNQEILDTFNGAKFKWTSNSTHIEKLGYSNKKRDNNASATSEIRFLELSFHKKYKDMVLRSYLPYIIQRAKTLREERKTLKLYTVDYNGTDYWGWTNLDHPARFDTMAMEPATKKELIEDLDRFMMSKEYYRRVGRAWKRGYLLYGPPGTGKSSLVASMANYLKFDVYDLDLREVQCNSDLRRLLIGTGSRSILVIEDIDCSVELQNRELEKDGREVEDDKITLSGLLNFIDGLWSSCVDERIIVFTTNHKDRLDPALLRPGRMDVHMHMSYCTFNGFKILASSYLLIQEHPLFGEIEQLIENVQATPAEVAGVLMKNNDAKTALNSVIHLLQSKAKRM